MQRHAASLAGVILAAALLLVALVFLGLATRDGLQHHNGVELVNSVFLVAVAIIMLCVLIRAYVRSRRDPVVIMQVVQEGQRPRRVRGLFMRLTWRWHLRRWPFDDDLRGCLPELFEQPQPEEPPLEYPDDIL